MFFGDATQLSPWRLRTLRALFSLFAFFSVSTALSAPREVLFETYSTGPLEFRKQRATGEGVQERGTRADRKRERGRERESEGSERGRNCFFFNWAAQAAEVLSLVWVSFRPRERLETICSARYTAIERESGRERASASLSKGCLFSRCARCPAAADVWFRRACLSIDASLSQR